MAIEDEVVQAVAIGNLKSISEQPAMISNLAYSNSIAAANVSQQNAVSNQQGANEVGLSVTGKAVNTVSKLGPLEARSAVDVLTNNELAQTIADLKSAVAAFAARARSGVHSISPVRGTDPSNPLGPNAKTYVRTPIEIVIVGATDPKDVHVSAAKATDDGKAAEITITTTP